MARDEKNKRYENEFGIFDLDKNALDEEWVNQPRFFAKYADRLAEAKANLSEVEASLELVSAELDSDIRRNPEKYGLEKITEPGVKKTILTQARYEKANQAVLNAQYKVDKLQVVVNALQHRKTALENLVSLRLADYYSEPRAPKEAREEMRERERRMTFNRRKKE